VKINGLVRVTVKLPKDLEIYGLGCHPGSPLHQFVIFMPIRNNHCLHHEKSSVYFRHTCDFHIGDFLR